MSQGHRPHTVRGESVPKFRGIYNAFLYGLHVAQDTIVPSYLLGSLEIIRLEKCYCRQACGARL